MKKIGILLFLLGGLMANAQSFGTTELNVNGTYNAAKPVYGTWQKEGTTAAIMKFNETADGLAKAIDTADKMLVQNNKSLTQPDIYNSVEGNDAQNQKDSATLHNSIQKGNTKINLAWKLDSGAMLHLLLNKNTYEITIMNAYK